VRMRVGLQAIDPTGYPTSQDLIPVPIRCRYDLSTLFHFIIDHRKGRFPKDSVPTAKSVL
jgi:hypothetical protein